jgi:PTH1 family peptidyl-tRNA hydrolase
LDKIVVAGLGNPGSQYDVTRHNLGFMFADNIADKFKKSMKCPLEYSDQGQYAVIKPMTYMNRSGIAVECFLRYYKISYDRLLVVCDDFNLPFGKIRLRTAGSSGGHNGLESIIDSLATEDFARLRIGIGGQDVSDKREYVLENFTKRELKLVSDLLIDARSVVEFYIKNGIEEAMNRYN